LKWPWDFSTNTETWVLARTVSNINTFKFVDTDGIIDWEFTPQSVVDWIDKSVVVSEESNTTKTIFNSDPSYITTDGFFDTSARLFKRSEVVSKWILDRTIDHDVEGDVKS